MFHFSRMFRDPTSSVVKKVSCDTLWENWNPGHASFMDAWGNCLRDRQALLDNHARDQDRSRHETDVRTRVLRIPTTEDWSDNSDNMKLIWWTSKETYCEATLTYVTWMNYSNYCWWCFQQTVMSRRTYRLTASIQSNRPWSSRGDVSKLTIRYPCLPIPWWTVIVLPDDFLSFILTHDISSQSVPSSKESR